MKSQPILSGVLCVAVAVAWGNLLPGFRGARGQVSTSAGSREPHLRVRGPIKKEALVHDRLALDRPSEPVADSRAEDAERVLQVFARADLEEAVYAPHTQFEGLGSTDYRPIARAVIDNDLDCGGLIAAAERTEVGSREWTQVVIGIAWASDYCEEVGEWLLEAVATEEFQAFGDMQEAAPSFAALTALALRGDNPRLARLALELLRPVAEDSPAWVWSSLAGIMAMDHLGGASASTVGAVEQKLLAGVDVHPYVEQAAWGAIARNDPSAVFMGIVMDAAEAGGPGVLVAITNLVGSGNSPLLSAWLEESQGSAWAVHRGAAALAALLRSGDEHASRFVSNFLLQDDRDGWAVMQRALRSDLGPESLASLLRVRATAGHATGGPTRVAAISRKLERILSEVEHYRFAWSRRDELVAQLREAHESTLERDPIRRRLEALLEELER